VVVGYSSGAIPTMLTGKSPAEHGHWNLFYYDPEGSPFRWLRRFQFLPDRVLGHRVARKVVKEVGRRALGLGPLFDCAVSPRLLPWKTIGENISLALKGAAIGRSEWDSRVAHYLKLVGLEEYVNQFPLYLSGGQRQRVGLARALAVESDIVLMDEPFASVDELTARQLRQTTRRLCEQLHRTVLFVTHNLAEAAYMSDYVVTLTNRPARLDAYVTNPLHSPRHWGPEIYNFAAELETKVTLKEDEGS